MMNGMNESKLNHLSQWTIQCEIYVGQWIEFCLIMSGKAMKYIINIFWGVLYDSLSSTQKIVKSLYNTFIG